MAERKKKNSIIEEQRKARQEFLELKKMQHGEMEPPPKPSEVAILPKTRPEKISNFWYQYKNAVIIGAAFVIIITVLISQCVARTDYDIEVVYFSYTPALDEQITAVTNYITEYAEDANGDGEVNVQVINCSYSASGGDTEYSYSVLQKLQAILAGDNKAMLYITDADSFEYLAKMDTKTSIFDGEPYKFGPRFYEATKIDDYGALPEGLQISCRRVSDTVLEDKKGTDKYYAAAKKIIEKVKE